VADGDDLAIGLDQDLVHGGIERSQGGRCLAAIAKAVVQATIR
jgi:hypothetical protein